MWRVFAGSDDPRAAPGVRLTDSFWPAHALISEHISFGVPLLERCARFAFAPRQARCLFSARLLGGAEALRSPAPDTDGSNEGPAEHTVHDVYDPCRTRSMLLEITPAPAEPSYSLHRIPSSH